MNPKSQKPTVIEIAFLNSKGFSQMKTASWKFFKLGYVFDLSSINIIDFIDYVWQNRLYLKISETIEEYVKNEKFNNS